MKDEIKAIQASTTDVVSIEASDSQLVDIWLHGRSAATQRGYRAEVTRFRAQVGTPLRAVTLAAIQGYADSLDSAGLQPATRRRMLAAVKSLFSFGQRLGYLPFNTAQPLRLPALRDTLAERIIDESSLLRMIDFEPNARNAAMIALMYGGALRVSELVGIRWIDLQPRADGQGQVSVFGKGQKTRVILFSASVFSRITVLRENAADEEFVFKSRKGGGRINTSHVLRITKRAARRAGIRQNVRNHDLRHSHCTHALERGAPIHLVQQTCAHASLSTTGKYLHARPGDSSARFLPL